ncbi:MAG: endonuclease/exonuclease/phosphatase family protein [Pirellulaceae bacterium]
MTQPTTSNVTPEVPGAAQVSDTVSELHAVSRPQRSLLLSFWVVCSWIALAMLIFSHLGRFFYLSELMVNFQLQLGCACFVLVLFLWCTREWFWSSILLIAILFTLSGPLKTTFQSRITASSTTEQIRLMSYNIFAGNSNEQAIIESIRAEDPDILILIEYSNSRRELSTFLHQHFNQQVEEPRYHGFGIAVFSKIPLLDVDIQYLTHDKPVSNDDPDYKDDPTVITAVSVNGKTLRIIGTHCYNPIDYNRYDDRNQQLERLAAIVAADTEQPTVLAGDFNCTPWSIHFRQLLSTTGMSDSRRGFGYQGSWPEQSVWLRIPIDQVLVTPGVEIVSRRIGNAGASDHLPVIADIRF